MSLLKRKRIALGCFAVLPFLVSSAFAAKVPEGVKLAAKQEIVRNNGAEVQSLDPQKVSGVPEAAALRDLLEGLIITNEDGKLIPGIAEKWDNKDFKVWTFYLRKDAKWSNGEPVTAQDFVYSFRRLVNPNTASPYATYLDYGHVLNANEIVTGKKKPEELGVKAINEHTLEFTLTESVPYFDALMIHTSMLPVHKATVEKHGDGWTRPENWVGNGAYVIDKWVINEHIILKKNPEYYDKENTIIEKATLLPISSEVTDVNRYRSGEIDITYDQLPTELFPKLKKEIPNEIKSNPKLCVYYYDINHNEQHLKDPRVRKALKLAVDRNVIVDKIMHGNAAPAYGFTPPYTDGMIENTPEWSKWTQKQREDEAKKLIEEAGYGENNPLNLTLLYNTSDVHQKIGIAVTSMWKKVLGANIKLENQEWKMYLDRKYQHKFELARSGWCSDYNEPTSFLNIYLSGSSNNYGLYHSDAFDNLLKSAIKESTKEDRGRVYRQAEQRLDEDSALIPIYYHYDTRLVKPYVGGYSTKDPASNFRTKNFYIIEH